MSLQFYALRLSVSGIFEYSSSCMSSLALNLMFIYKINVCLNNDDYVEVVIHVLFVKPEKFQFLE